MSQHPRSGDSKYNVNPNEQASRNLIKKRGSQEGSLGVHNYTIP